MTDEVKLVLLSVGAGLGGIFILWGLIKLLTRRPSRAGKHLEEHTQDSGVVSLPVSIRAKQPATFSERFNDGFDNLIARTQLNVTSEGAISFAFMCGAIVGAVCYFWREQPETVLLGFLIGFIIPLGALWFLSGRYRRRVQDLLPDTFYLLSRFLRAGMSLRQALVLVEQQGVKPLSDEFARVNASIQLGLPIAASLERMAKRVQLVDFNSFVSTIALHENVGGKLPHLLDRLAASARDHNQFRRQFFATTAQGRITAIILGLAVPLLLLIYLTSKPAQLDTFFETPRGWATLAFAVVLQVIGAIWIFRILKIEY